MEELLAFVEALTSDDLSPTIVLTVLSAGPKLLGSQQGSELLLNLGFRAAQRWGVAAQFLDKLRPYAVPPPPAGEPRH